MVVRVYRENSLNRRVNLKISSRKTRSRKLAGLLLASIGYILSPLSWWNDAFINIPLSIAVAYLLHALLGLNRLIGFYLGYMITNAAGMFLLIYGGQLIMQKPHRVNNAVVIATSIAYSIIASVLLHIIGLI